MINRSILAPDEPLHGHVSQAGVPPGSDRLATFQKALALRNTPPLYSQENVPGKQACVRFFDPCGSWTWYAVEWDGKDTCFGYVVGHEPEWGYFDVRELSSYRGQLGIGIEVDEFFTPRPVPEKEQDATRSLEQSRELEPGD